MKKYASCRQKSVVDNKKRDTDKQIFVFRLGFLIVVKHPNET